MKNILIHYFYDLPSSLYCLFLILIIVSSCNNTSPSKNQVDLSKDLLFTQSQDFPGPTYERTPKSIKLDNKLKRTEQGIFLNGSSHHIKEKFKYTGKGISVALWIKPLEDLKLRTLRKQLTSHFWGSHQFQYFNGRFIVELYDEDRTLHVYYFVVNLPKEDRNHVAFSVTAGADVFFYLNGEKFHLGEAPSSLRVVENPLSIGSIKGKHAYRGWMDDLRIYGRELNQSEINKLSQNTQDKI
ncbi:MAG: LamG domain-containing protein [Deltaproteobacteria bacterium]|jgi:hypothetical protein|nr:LamG domain-containing protein [Deltaproteobacteria bacterium]MBT4526275.1 LamG domain-containing protein [Deltaproteobacteria bacterium]